MQRRALLTLLDIHDLHLAPLDQLGRRARMQHHPTTASKKWELEDELQRWLDEQDATTDWDLPDDAVAAMRRIAHRDLIPPVYEWLADEASFDEVVAFLSIEGGPDGGFDDLVAVCQVGLDGTPKVEMAQNYWDEMGNGTLTDVHTELHRRLSRALGLQVVPRDEQPVEALRRSALGSFLATNRWLQPEMVGALGLIELQAGPRCRKVLAALRRIDAPSAAYDFYEEHAVADPRHGKDWLGKVIAPLAEDPEWATRMVRGARWRSIVNHDFFAALAPRQLQLAS